MPKSILIHNNNINLEKLPKEMEHLSFGLNKDVNNSSILDNDIDKYMSKFIETIKNEGNFDLIFIKDNLSENYLDLYGILLAYHIRLDTDESIKYLPIVIISDLDSHILNLLTPLARILFTKYIFFIKNHPDEIAKMQKKVYEKALTKENFQENFQDNFLNLIKVEPPENSSNHSIANEWAIDRWATVIGMEEKEIIKENRKNIASKLYFDYLKASFQKQDEEVPKIVKLTQEGEVLLIDDEWNKGWSEIIETILKSEKVLFKTFEFLHANHFDDIDFSKIDTFPDVIILDLRLTKNDQESDNIDEYSGIQFLDKIKKFNKGIQVIMLTATSKSTTLEELYKKDILGYIKKEHPTDTTINTIDNINKLIGLVDTGLERKYLKKIWNIQKHILKLNIFKEDEFKRLLAKLKKIKFTSSPKVLTLRDFEYHRGEFYKKFKEDAFKEIKFEIESIFEILDSEMKNKFIYAMFAIFKSLEFICDIYFEEKQINKKGKKWKEWKAFWKGTGDYIYGYTTKDRLNEICKKINILNINTLAKTKIQSSRDN